MPSPTYEFRTQGNTLKSLAFLVLSIIAVLFGSWFGAPIYWYIPIGFCLLFGAWYFMSNPNQGCRLTGDTLEVWSDKAITRFPIASITHVETKNWSDGPDDFTLVLEDGTNAPISYLQFGDSAEFRTALETAGIKLMPNA